MNRLARFAGFGHQEAAPDSRPPGPPAIEQEVAIERMDPEELRDPIIAALRQVHDPEIPVNIYDLGLIYRIDIAANGDVAVDMTLTAPACPVAGMMPVLVEEAVRTVEGVGKIQVELVWDPPWNPEMLSEEARLELGMV